MISKRRRHNSLSKEVLQAYDKGRFIFILKNGVITISDNISDIAISVRYIVGLSEFYHQNNKSISRTSHKVVAQKVVLYTFYGQSAILNQILTKIKSVLPLVLRTISIKLNYNAFTGS